MGDPPRDDTLEVLRGALSGRYAFERVLGEGAMGRVVLARDLTLDRLVAIKVISSELAAASSFRERFLLEARTVAKLRHPNIVTVHEAGEAAGHLYFVMEYVPGESLRGLLDRTAPATAERTADILGHIADALAYAHAQGIVHRDIKPENILLDGESGRAMLTDFGIARALSTAGDGRLTGTGLVVGSPRYMSPEQAAGERELDGRTDIYSLGLIGYEMLTGESPFPGASGASLIAKQITQPAPPVRSRAPNAPPTLAGAIDRALEKDPARRWQNAAEMMQALRAGAPVALLPRGSKVRRWWPAVAAAAVAAFVAAAAGGILRPSRSSAADERRPVLVIPFGVLRGDASLDWLRPGSVDMLTRNLAQWRDVPVVDYEHTLDLIREAKLEGDRTIGLNDARQLGRQADAGTVVLGQIQRNGDSLAVVARVYDVDDGTFVKEFSVGGLAASDARWLFDELANKLLGLAGAPSLRKVQVARITTSSVEAYRHYLHGARSLHAWNLDAADSAFERATTIDSTFSLAYYKRAQTQGWRRVADTLGRHYARQAAAHSARLPARERALVEGLLDFLEGNYTRAQQRFGALLAQDSTDAEAWYGLGDAYHHAPPQGPEDIATRYTRSLRAFNRAIAHDSSFHLAYSHRIEVYQRVGAPGFAWIIEGDSLRYLGSEDDARRFGRERIERARAHAREMAINSALRWVDADPSAGPAYQALADAYAAARQYDQAIATLERAMRQPASRHADFAYRIASYQLASRPNDALATLRQAMRTYGPDSLARRGTAHRLGVLRAAANVTMATGALGDLDRLFAIATSVDPVVPGSVRAGRAVPTASATAPLRVAVRAIAGITAPSDRRVIDTAIAHVEATPEPAGSQVRKQSAGLAYAGYLITQDPKYIDVFRRWSGETPPVLEALAALKEGDTAKAAQVAARFPPPDTGRIISTPDPVDDPLSRGLILAAVGQPRAALAVLESINPARFNILEGDTRWAMYGRSLLERGLLYEQVGNRAQALAAYERYLDLMRNADPLLQPQLQIARARVQALRDAPASALPPR